MTATTTTTSTDKPNELTRAQQIQNHLFGLWSWLLLASAVFWTIRLWIYQRQHGKPVAMPRLIIFLSDSHSMQDVAGILKQWDIRHMNYCMCWTVAYGDPRLECSVIVNGAQFDYADGILHSQGVTLINQAGTSRGYAFNHPPAQRTRAQTSKRSPAKLGKTYRG